MSRENVDVVRQMFDAWSGGDIEHAMSTLDPEVEWRMAEDEPDARTLYGRAEVLDMLGGWVGSFADFVTTPHEFIDAGNDVVVPITFVATPHGGETSVTIEETQIYTVERRTVVKVREYRTQAEALEAIRDGT